MLKPNEEVTPETMYESAAAIPSEMEMEIEALDMHSAKDFRTFVVFFFLLCIVSALFSCVISYTARRSGLKEHMGPPKHLFSSPSPKPFLYNNINNNKNAIDVKDWMSLVYNPEEPLNKELAKELSSVLESKYLFVGTPSRYSQTLHYDEMLY